MSGILVFADKFTGSYNAEMFLIKIKLAVELIDCFFRRAVIIYDNDLPFRVMETTQKIFNPAENPFQTLIELAAFY